MSPPHGYKRSPRGASQRVLARLREGPLGTHAIEGLSVSLNAFSSHICNLRKAGYVIETCYVLRHDPDRKQEIDQ